MMFDLTRFWVCLSGLFSPTAATKRENRQELCPRKKERREKKKGSLFMDDATLVYFCAWPSE